MLVQNMPHKLRDRSAQCLYLRAVISLSEGRAGATLREGLLMGVVEHLLTIDADIRWEDIVDAPTGVSGHTSPAALAWKGLQAKDREPVCIGHIVTLFSS